VKKHEVLQVKKKYNFFCQTGKFKHIRLNNGISHDGSSGK